MQRRLHLRQLAMGRGQHFFHTQSRMDGRRERTGRARGFVRGS